MSKLIQWPRAKYWDKAWNPIIGCVPCSPACENCYAKALMARFPQYGDINGEPWFGPRKTASRRPPANGVVFVGNMTDLFGEWMWQFGGAREMVNRTMGRPGTTFLWLTKRPWDMVLALTRGEPLRFQMCGMNNQWFGMTAENQEWLDRRYADFRRLPAHMNGWLSAEPLLGPIEIGLLKSKPEARPFQWVVVGCESGPHRRPCKVEWVESIVAQCRSAGVPVFVKQLDIGGRCITDIEKFPKDLQIRQVPWARKGGPA